MTGLSKPAAGALLTAPLTKGSKRTWLFALSPVPAGLAGLTGAGDWRACCIQLAVATAFSALYSIVARVAGQLTAGSIEARRAGTMARSNTALASNTLAPVITLRTPPARQAGTVARVLHTGRVVTAALEAAAAAPPSRWAQAGSSGLVTACCWVALAWATTRG